MSKKTILIVDDEKIIRDMIRKVNDFYGVETLEAEDGEVGWSVFQEHSPDLTISDIYMPNMNGLMLLRNIRRKNPYAKVILITGYGHYKQLLDDQKSRPDGFFEKPFSVADLSKKIEKLLKEPDSNTEQAM
jgi:YesN/AraC family two-component response regulator